MDINVLPYEQDLKCWSKEKIRRIIFSDPRLEKYRCKNKNYRVSPATIALYNFADRPLLDQYKTVIFDEQEGIVLTEKNSRQLLNDFVRDKLIDFSHSRFLQELLDIKNRHVLCFGNYSYFSLEGYSKRAVDWVALHRVMEVDFVHDQSSFLAPNDFIFHFDQHFVQMKNNVIEAVTTNHIFATALGKMLKTMGFHSKKNSHAWSLSGRKDYVSHEILERKVKLLALRDFKEWENLRLTRAFFETEFGLPILETDIYQLQAKIKGKRYLW